MDELRLAQIDNFHHQLSSRQRHEILKGINVNYCLQDEPHLTPQIRDRIGTTYSHVAAQNLYYADVKELLSQGADLFKQTVLDGSTPLLSLLSCYSVKTNFDWKKTGKLKNQMADILLSAQVESGNASNPKNEDGFSHFLIACAVNHKEAVKFFLNAGEPLDQAIGSDKYSLPGYSALHFATRYSALETVEILINCGADIFLKDAQARSSLHLLLERLMDLADYVNMGKRACCLVCKEEIERIESIVHYIFRNKKDSMNFADDTGLTAFHVACVLTDTSIAESFMKQNINIDSYINNDAKFWSGYTPLHFAACCNVETVKLLLQRGLHMIKNTAGETPLDLCLERYSPKVVHSILSCKPEFKNILLSDGSTTLLDILLLMNDCDQFSTFLQDSKNVNLYVPYDSPLWPGNTLLHLSILMNEKTRTLKKFYETFTLEESTDSTDKSYNCSETEEVAYWKRIVICLVQGCSLDTKNADGLTPIHLAFKLRKANVVDKFLNSCKSNVADPNNLTHFHIACIVGKKSLVEEFLNNGAKLDSQVNSSFEWYGKPLWLKDTTPSTVIVRANSTALHLAVIFEHLEIVELLLKNGADIHAQDASGLTPIHRSIRFDKKARPMAQLLLNSDPNLREVVSKQNLTHLHVAAWVNDGQAVDKLLKAGSDVDAIFNYERKKQENHRDDLWYFAQETPLYTAAKKESGDAVRALILAGADMTIKKVGSCWNDSPFNRALSNMHTDAARCLIKKAKRVYRGIIGPIDESGVTMLHVACGSFDLVWAKKLLESGADVNALVREYGDDDSTGETPLKVLVCQTPYLADNPPKNLMSLVKLLLKYGADVTIKNQWETPLLSAYRYAEEEKSKLFLSLADLMLRSHISYGVNPTEFNGFSHMHFACVRNNIEIVQRFLDGGIDIDHHVDYFSGEYDSGFTSLHFAFDCRHLDLARMLIERGANVNAEARNGNTPLHVAVMKNCMDLQLMDMLHRNGCDFSAKNLIDMTPLMCLFTVNDFTLKQLDFFLKRDAKFDLTHFQSSEGMIGLAIKNARSSDREIIFQELIKNNDLITAIDNGFNAIHSIVSVNQNGRLSLEFYMHTIKRLVKMGCNLDQQNENGRTPLHDAVFFYNIDAVEALLLLGADLNVVDKKNKSPLSILAIANDKVAKERKSRVADMVVMHAWKLKLLGLTLDSSIEKDMLTLSGNECIVDSAAQSRWQNELNKMDDVEISHSLTAKTFMYGGVSTYPFMVSSERELVDKFFKNSENITQSFPECGCILNMQYKKAIFKLKQL